MAVARLDPIEEAEIGGLVSRAAADIVEGVDDILRVQLAPLIQAALIVDRLVQVPVV